MSDTEYRRYFCHIRVNTTFNAGNLPKQNIEDLDDRIKNALVEWANDMTKKGLSVDIWWDWSEHLDLKK